MDSFLEGGLNLVRDCFRESTLMQFVPFLQDTDLTLVDGLDGEVVSLTILARAKENSLLF